MKYITFTMESVAGRLDYNDGTTTSKIKSLAAAATPRRHYRIYKVVHSRYQVPSSRYQVPSSRYKGASGQISTRAPILEYQFSPPQLQHHKIFSYSVFCVLGESVIKNLGFNRATEISSWRLGKS